MGAATNITGAAFDGPKKAHHGPITEVSWPPPPQVGSSLLKQLSFKFIHCPPAL